MPISKQRNKHIQRTLVQTAKLAPRDCHELAAICDREKQKGNENRETLAVARNMVAYLLALNRQQRDFVPGREMLGKGSVNYLQNKWDEQSADCQVLHVAD